MFNFGLSLSSRSFNATSFRVSLAGQDITDKIRPILIDLKIVDKAGITSDTAQIVLDNTNGQLVVPPAGSVMVIDLDGRANAFIGKIDEPKSNGARGQGRTIAISAKSMDTRGNLKTPRQKSWENKTLGDVLPEAGKLAGLTDVQVHSDFASIMREHTWMDGHNFVAFGEDLAAEYGATFKIYNDKAVFVPRGQGVSASGQALPKITAEWGKNLISWSDVSPDIGRPQFQDVAGRWYDLDAAAWKNETESVSGASVEGSQALAAARENKDAAKAAAGSEAKESERAKGAGRVEIDGDINAQAEAKLELKGADPYVDGTYKISGVTQQLNRQRGFITSCDLAQPSGGAGVDDR